ncbi:filamentation induced by cAMP protein Fic [Nitritalea halalkaliphila LW7]|uniref:Filamentation induced by cAMP protein Fic n=1 Tax=Nitritalea halalkaliphila LW7 TaxID=1189621 RepID=I5C9B9_9BACT|nr:Fic family protein [Nitritalea halalkaliphila]EIM78421.1 filamentation induced by cAMP protein Fic [Nitritalea halalkaliphila LW7]
MKDIKNFKAGTWLKQIEYRSFSPNHIHESWVLSDPAILTLLSQADRNLGRLDAFSDLVPDIDFFIKMHVTKEATVSSKIEGTQTSFQEALANEEDIDPERRDDWQEVHAYIKAMNQAIQDMEKLPISTRLIRKTHAVLLDGVRGQEKLPGEFRNSQNWIGPSLKHAVFVPPLHTEVHALMSDLEKFIHDDHLQIPHLVKIAMVHYQFETIHPFLDGNGRVGRLLITLYLLDKGLLKYPTLYLSDYFERNRRDYYDNLMRVREKDAMGEWIAFFLKGVIETTTSGIRTFQEIIRLREKYEFQELIKLGKKQGDAKRLITELYRQPIVDVGQVEKMLDVHNSTANRMIRDFQELGILEELTGFKRNRIFAFKEYINLFR